ncbi:MAG: hypothetical protein CMI56_00250 [Parcubacteria group bacterium]|nr:hypothetical protein [Parcubacteria group bacterium]
MAVETRNAASHLRLVAHQKSGVTQELEAMHNAMRELGAELTKLQEENKRLKLQQRNPGKSKPTSTSKTVSRTPQSAKSSKIARTVHVDRKGNVKVKGSYKKIHSPKQGHVHMQSKRSHGHGHDHDGPWMLGVDQNAGSSIRRGSYYGMYSDNAAIDKRRMHRTRSTVDRRFLTPMPGSEMEVLYTDAEEIHSNGWHIHRSAKKNKKNKS